MTKPHASLRPTTNIVAILAWAIAAVVTSSLVTPRPILVMAFGVLLGVLGGYMQVLSFNEGRESFLSAITAMDVRRKMKETKWGKRYIYFLWSSGALLMIASFLISENPALVLPTAYFSMMFAREIVTLKPTFELQRMQTQSQ
jgi:hypothetical protein